LDDHHLYALICSRPSVFAFTSSSAVIAGSGATTGLGTVGLNDGTFTRRFDGTKLGVLGVNDGAFTRSDGTALGVLGVNDGAFTRSDGTKLAALTRSVG